MFGFQNRHRHHFGRHAVRGQRRVFAAAFGDGFDGETMGLGGFGRHRGGGGRRRIFESTELRLVLLRLIADQPRHGYDLIKAVEELSGGGYAPSPGVVYPTLTMLQDMGLIAERSSEGSKRLFAITDAGVADVEANAEQIEALLARLRSLGKEREGEERSPIRRAMLNLALALRSRTGRGDDRADLAHDIAAILDETAQRIERL